MHQAFEKITAAVSKWDADKGFEIESLKQAGSNRQYFRLKKGEQSYILTYNPSNVPENNAFVSFTKHFSDQGLFVPSIEYVEPGQQFYIQSDLGDLSLFDVIKQEGFTEEVKKLFKKTCTALAQLQIVGGRNIDYSNCIATRSFDKQAIYSDLLYFLYYFVRALD
ncbi:MAG: hypothetical protein RL640_795, partial [Bacteroidota bacterium]